MYIIAPENVMIRFSTSKCSPRVERSAPSQWRKLIPMAIDTVPNAPMDVAEVPKEIASTINSADQIVIGTDRYQYLNGHMGQPLSVFEK